MSAHKRSPSQAADLINSRDLINCLCGFSATDSRPTLLHWRNPARTVGAAGMASARVRTHIA